MRAKAFVFASLLAAAVSANAQHAGDTSALAVSPFPVIMPSIYLDADAVGPAQRRQSVAAQLRSVCAEVTDHPRAWSINQRNGRLCSATKQRFGEAYTLYLARQADGTTRFDTAAVAAN